MIAEHPAPRGCIADPKSVTSPPAAARQGRLSSVAGPAPSRGQSGRSDTPRSQAQADVWRCGWIGRSGRCV